MARIGILSDARILQRSRLETLWKRCRLTACQRCSHGHRLPFECYLSHYLTPAELLSRNPTSNAGAAPHTSATCRGRTAQRSRMHDIDRTSTKADGARAIALVTQITSTR